MRWAIATLFSVLLVVLMSQTSSAHVLLMDESNTSGAILHIMPDDDPIAGELSDMYFDRQGAAGTDKASVSLSISNGSGEVQRVQLETTGSLSTGEYTFPAQGVYELTFTVQAGENEYTYTQTQRVSRGIASASSETPKYYWAEALLVGTAVAFLVLVIIALNRRGEIARHSTF